jgi:hypothetical protein
VCVCVRSQGVAVGKLDRPRHGITITTNGYRGVASTNRSIDASTRSIDPSIPVHFTSSQLCQLRRPKEEPVGAGLRRLAQRIVGKVGSIFGSIMRTYTGTHTI